MFGKAIMLLLAVAVLGAAGPAVAGPGPAGQEPGARAERFQQWLGLTEEQMAGIKAIHERQRDARRQLVRRLHAARAELRRLSLAGGEEGLIQARTEEIAQLARQLTELRVKTLQEMAPLLTPEQREKLAAAGRGPHRHRPGHPIAPGPTS